MTYGRGLLLLVYPTSMRCAKWAVVYGCWCILTYSCRGSSRSRRRGRRRGRGSILTNIIAIWLSLNCHYSSLFV